MLLNIYAPIISSKSIGNISIGDEISKYIDIIEKYHKENKVHIIRNDHIIKIIFNDIPIEIFVENEKIYQLSATSGYKGKFNNMIAIGDKAKEVFCKDKNFYYDEFYESLSNKIDKGIMLEFSYDIPWNEKTKIEDLSIEYITIFDPEKTPL